jgi:protein-arginine kinase activator protein McsA
MKEAVENENYERASELRDEIRRIETGRNPQQDPPQGSEKP